jgi:MFS family permease
LTLVRWKSRLCGRPITLRLDLLHRIEVGSAALLEIAEPEYTGPQLRKPACLRQSETTDLLGGLFFAPGLDLLPIMPAVPLPVGPMLHLVNPCGLHGIPPNSVPPGERVQILFGDSWACPWPIAEKPASWFTRYGVRRLIAATYAVSGFLLAVAGYFFAIGVLSATGQTIAWMVIFFFASAAASSAYLTVSETFPLEVRALAIAFFCAIGTGIGGVAGPWLFGALIDTGSRWSVYGGYLLGSALMIAAALVAARFCVAAERKPLEAVARPLDAAD